VATRQKKGQQGELLAAEFLERQGLRIASRNFRCPLGEIDLVAWDQETVVIVEVRSRYSKDFGLAQESVSVGKQQRLTRLGQWYLKQNRLEGRPARFDVIAIDWSGGEPRITWIPNAFEACPW
jgi:putative endonuclease